jgi:hippurate hydrolase
MRPSCSRVAIVSSLASVLVAGAPVARAGGPPELAGLDAAYPRLDALYQDLHRNPELSTHEDKTAGKMAARLRELGFEVTDHVGGFGVVGVLRNGTGPTVLVRTDMDALPVKEQTGLAYASTVTTKNDAGDAVSVMHACGHDIHMTSWVGAATLLVGLKAKWHGTLIMVGQPAEEVVSGARSMLEAGLLTRFPKPDFALAIHDTAAHAAGQVGLAPGYAMANTDAVDITFHGKGGHGAAPQATIDPVLMAARTVVTLQSIVARELNPLDPAVITVGTFHAGTKRNIIPDDARIELTVRSYKPEVQKHLLASIARIAKAEAAAAGATREPTVFVDPKQTAQALYNDPAMIERLRGALRRALGDASVVPSDPIMPSEDFGAFGRAAGIPSVMLWVGAVEPGAFAKAKADAATTVPGLHTGGFSPDRERTIRTGVSVITVSVLELMTKAR